MEKLTSREEQAKISASSSGITIDPLKSILAYSS